MTPACPLLARLAAPTPGTALPASGAPALATPPAQFPSFQTRPGATGGTGKTLAGRPTPRPRRPGRPRLCGWGLLPGRRWPRGGEAGAAARLSAGAGAGSCVSGSRPSPPPPPPAGPPAAAARPPRGLAGCRLPRRGFAPFSRPLRLPELIWELFISCQKAAGPAERATLAAGPPGFGPGVAALGRSRPARLAPRGLPGTPSHPGRARGGGASPAHLVALRSPEEASRGLLPARGCGES